MRFQTAGDAIPAPPKEYIDLPKDVPAKIRIFDPLNEGILRYLMYDVMYGIPKIDDRNGKMVEGRLIAPSMEDRTRLLVCDGKRFLSDFEAVTRYNFVCLYPAARQIATLEGPRSLAEGIQSIAKALEQNGLGNQVHMVPIIVTRTDHGKWMVTSNLTPEPLSTEEQAIFTAGFNKAVEKLEPPKLTIPELCAAFRMQYIQDDAQLAQLRGNAVAGGQAIQDGVNAQQPAAPPPQMGGASGFAGGVGLPQGGTVEETL